MTHLDQLDAFWRTHGDTLVLGAGGVLVLLVGVLVWQFARSTRKDRWYAGVSLLLVMVWTVEGTWEVVTQKLGLPWTLALAMCVVAESMALACGARAEQHRAAHGVPGPSGRLAWGLAFVFGGIVALSASTLVEFLFRWVVPLSAVALWWLGLTAERPEDTDGIKAARERAARDREATWAVTPRSLLVAVGLMKPGRTSTTQAQRDRQLHRMVVLADRADRAPEVSRLRAWRLRRLRALTRTADQAMVDEAAARVDRARRSADLILNCRGSAERGPAGPESASPGPAAPEPTRGSRSPNGAPMAGKSSPKSGKAGRRTTAQSAMAKAQVEAAWDRDIAAGRTPVAAAIAAEVGCDPSYAREVIRNHKKEIQKAPNPDRPDRPVESSGVSPSVPTGEHAPLSVG